MKPILDAIKTRLYATSTLTAALGSRIYLDQAPPNESLPLLVYGMNGTATVTRMMGGVSRYEITVEFTFQYANAGTTAIHTASEALETAFATSMAATGFDRVTAIKASGGVPSFSDDAWSMTDTYRVIAHDT